MVSTRGIKPKFDIGERVLCYDPDPKKMKMLYDAKILDVFPSQQGSPDDKKRGFDYYVHFLGWSSTWDRLMAIDMILKDNEGNRKEQMILYEQTDEYRARMLKKKKRKSTEKPRTSLDSNPSPVPSDTSEIKYQQAKRGCEERLSVTEDEEIQFNRFRLEAANRPDDSEPETDTQTEPADSPRVMDGLEKMIEEGKEDEAEDVCTELLNITLPQQLKAGLETDYNQIKGGKLVQLPAQPNIVILLEGFVRNFAISKLAALEKQNQKYYNQYRQPDKQESELFDEVVTAINIAKEVAEGFRIIIDFQIGIQLLYPQESDQFVVSRGIRPHMENIERLMAGASPPPHQTPAPKQPAAKKATAAPVDSQGDSTEGTGSARKRTARTSVKKESESETVSGVGGAPVPGSAGSASSGGAETPNPLSASSNTQYPQTKKSHQILQELYSWKLVPESLYFEEPVPASLVYGGVHLARLLVNIPDLLVKMKFPNKKLKYLLKYLEFMVEYMAASQDTFADSVYKDAKNS